MSKSSTNWRIFDDNGSPVCNFNFQVVAWVNIFCSDDSEPVPHVRLKIHFSDDDEDNKTIVLPQASLESTDWFSRAKGVVLNPPYKKARLSIALAIRSMLTDAPVENKYVLNKLGIHNIDGKIVFCAGDRIIRPPDAHYDFDVEPGAVQFRLDIDTDLSKEEAVHSMMRAANLCPAGRLMVAHAISGFTRSCYRAINVTPSAILEVTGKTGIFKSSYTSFMVQLYNRMDGISPDTRFNSSTRFIEELLYENSECTSVIDDICTAGSSSIKRKNEETAEELKRRIGDNKGRGRWNSTTREQRNPRGNAVFTGEYPTGKESTAARGLIVPFQMPDPQKFAECQREPLAVSTCYFYFIQWFVSNYNQIRNELDRRLLKHREVYTEIHPRLRETQFCLQTAYMLFLQFCFENGLITEEVARLEYDYVGRLLTSLIHEQHTRTVAIDQDTTEEMDYPKLIHLLCNGSKRYRFNLAKNSEQFDPKQYDGFYHENGLLCLRTEKLISKLKMFHSSTRLSEVISSLTAMNAIKTDKDKNTIKVCNYRVLAIWLDKLK